MVAAAIVVALVSMGSAYAQHADPSESFATATVTRIVREYADTQFDLERTVQIVEMRIASGSEEGKVIQIENGILGGRDDMRLTEGETVIVDRQITAAGETLYLVRENYRLPSTVWLVALFAALCIAFGGWTGLTSIAGLAASVAILVWYVLPRIVAGDDPLTTSLIASIGIACTSLYLAHGFNRRTSVALLSTIVTLGISAGVAVLFVQWNTLFGMGSEEAVFLLTGPLATVDLRGLLLGGIIIGCLGVLDDITTAQTAAIAEISKANPRLSVAELWKAGRAIGKEHIASLINTLALAYAGASLPLLLLLYTQADYPSWVTLNSEFLSEEIIRTLVGSSTLLFAVPISTWFAASAFQGGRGGEGGHGHSHGLR